MDTIYFVFGQTATKIIVEDDFDTFLEYVISEEFNDGYELYVWKKDGDPIALLNAYQGYEDFCTITEDEYLKLNDL